LTSVRREAWGGRVRGPSCAAHPPVLGVGVSAGRGRHDLDGDRGSRPLLGAV